MKGVIADSQELEFCLHHKPDHKRLIDGGYRVLNLAHSGRVLYVTYLHSPTSDYKIIQWIWGDSVGWVAFLTLD